MNQGTYLLLVTINEEHPQTWVVYDGNYYKSFDSLDEGLQFIRSQNEDEPGMFPEGTYQFLYGVWSSESAQALSALLETAAQPYV